MNELKNNFYSDLNTRNTPLIIAEIGAKYGSIDTVIEMTKSANDCGVDMVKYQTYKAETISTPGSKFNMEDGSVISQYDYFKKYELDKEDHNKLNELCAALKIEWTSTPSHITDLELLEKYDLPCYKTGSDDITNLPFLKTIAEKGKPLLVSTGMCTLSEIEAAVETVFKTGNKQLVLLHCVVSYPSHPEDANLKIIHTLKSAFGLPIGLSDHTQDELTSVLATQMGVCVIEKHFTLDHKLKLPDHEASLDPKQFSRLVEKVRLVPEILGTGIKSISQTEKKWREASRKSIYSICDIDKGCVIKEEYLELRRPSNGLHPKYYNELVGKKTSKFVPKNSLISLDMVQLN